MLTVVKSWNMLPLVDLPSFTSRSERDFDFFTTQQHVKSPSIHHDNFRVKIEWHDGSALKATG